MLGHLGFTSVGHQHRIGVYRCCFPVLLPKVAVELQFFHEFQPKANRERNIATWWFSDQKRTPVGALRFSAVPTSYLPIVDETSNSTGGI